jgi:hypothetical protein
VADAITARVPRPDEFALARQQLEEEGDPFAFRATWEHCRVDPHREARIRDMHQRTKLFRCGSDLDVTSDASRCSRR